jgi:putative oxidoreductase
MPAPSTTNSESTLVSKAPGSNASELSSTRPGRYDWGLLWLRAWFGLSLFLKHGWEKPTNFAQMAQHFPDPLHIGPVPSLIFALTSDAICSILVILGLGTRWAALLILVNISVAWSFVHHFQFFGRGTASGEAIVLYLGGFCAVALLGPGRFSLDYKLRIRGFLRQSW